MNADEETFFDFHGVREGDELKVGQLTFRVMHTPGHTPTHISYVASDGEKQAVFTGGSMLYGSVGRTDLVAMSMAEELTRKQYATARRLAEELDDDTTVLPTHGFGSFCSSAAADEQTADVDPKYGVEISTIGEQRRANLALTITDEEEFVSTLLSGSTPTPATTPTWRPRNKVGPEGIDLSPPVEADPTELRRASTSASGSWTCAPAPPSPDHVVGTINVEVGNSFITYLAWILPWGTPVTLVGDTPEEVAEAQRQLVRVGIDRPAARPPAAWRSSAPASTTAATRSRTWRTC
jgi:hydroxyacylglutathione hydrolase